MSVYVDSLRAALDAHFFTSAWAGGCTCGWRATGADGYGQWLDHREAAVREAIERRGGLYGPSLQSGRLGNE
jgi:hypothetical protein